MSSFIVTDRAHADCARCAQCATVAREHAVTTSDGWTCDVCGQDVNGSGQVGESVRHI